MTADRLRLLACIALALALIAPLLPLAVWSVAHGWRFPDLVPADLSTRAWAYALSPVSGVLQSLWTTVLIAALTTGIAALVGVPAGRAIGAHDFRGKRLVILLLLAPALVPTMAIAPGLHGAFLHLGLTGSIPGVVMAHLIPVIPYMTLVMAASFARLDPAFEDQARLLGATPRQALLHVTLPAILPGLLTGALFAFLVSWSQYLLTLVIGGGQVQTLPLTLYSFAAAGRNDVTGAIAVIYMLPGLVVLALTLRRITGRHPALARGLAP